MAPVRVALIGLSGAPAAEYEGVNWAAGAHLPYLLQSPHYELIGLLNSSVATAQRAIKTHKLSESLKTYESPDDLAADPDVDMVVCCVRVDRHLQTTTPSIRAGKIIFTEWPLEANMKLARESLELAKKHNARTIIGLQGAFGPPARRIKQLIDEGRIGKVLSGAVYASLGSLGAEQDRNIGYFLDRQVGGNPISIHVGHLWECFEVVHGPFKKFDSLMSIQRPNIAIVDLATTPHKVLDPAAPNSVPDQIMLHGTTTSGAPLSIIYRGGEPFPSTPKIEWRIVGSKGEIRLTGEDLFIHVEWIKAKIELWDREADGGKGKVEAIDWDDEQEHLPRPARNIARVYEAYRKGEWVPDFNWAIRRHEAVDEMWRQFDAAEAEGKKA